MPAKAPTMTSTDCKPARKQQWAAVGRQGCMRLPSPTCPRQQDEIRPGKRMRTCTRCGCGCAHATIMQQLKCTLAKHQHSRPAKSRARSSVAVGQLVRGGVGKGRTGPSLLLSESDRPPLSAATGERAPSLGLAANASSTPSLSESSLSE
jgi:hypothetical protein